MKTTLRKIKGFTLIELIVVIVIIGILAAIAAPAFLNLSDDADTAADEQSANAVKSAIVMLYGENGSFPSVTTLAANVISEGSAATAVATGVQLASGTIVLTYTDGDCSTATTAVGDLVQCAA